ncbi:MAG TPA: hypothetical protein VM240_07080 [Verrucomicrobiae bacterium]|nr:hypothetical protein [Verrucomicrobiae bacterium]
MHRFFAALAGSMIFLAFPVLAEPLDLRFGLHLQFGAGTLASPGYSLALHPAAPGQLPVSLLQLDLSERAALGRIAGMPLSAQAYQTTAVEGQVAEGTTPWFARKWVLWTLGSLAATAALAAGGGDIQISGNDNNTTVNEGSHCTGGVSGSVNDDTEVPCAPAENTGCANGICVTCANGDIASTCPESGLVLRAVVTGANTDPERLRWLDAGTGHMGDLFPR